MLNQTPCIPPITTVPHAWQVKWWPGQKVVKRQEVGSISSTQTHNFSSKSTTITSNTSQHTLPSKATTITATQNPEFPTANCLHMSEQDQWKSQVPQQKLWSQTLLGWKKRGVCGPVRRVLGSQPPEQLQPVRMSQLTVHTKSPDSVGHLSPTSQETQWRRTDGFWITKHSEGGLVDSDSLNTVKDWWILIH